MVVLGDGRVDFVVTQWINGRQEDDSQEVELAEGVEIEVDAGNGGIREKAKL